MVGKLTKYVTAANMLEFIKTSTYVSDGNQPYTIHAVEHEHIRNTCNTCGYCTLTHPLDYKGAHNEHNQSN